MKKKTISKIVLYENPYLWISVIVAATVVVYLPSLGASFTSWDDGAYLYENPFIKVLSWTTIKGIFSTNYMGNYHPLAMLSLAFDYSINKYDPFVFHLTNLLLHCANSILVFFVVKALSKRTDIAVAAGLLFGIHSLHVESVAWVSERKDVLYAFFYLLAMYSYIRFTNRKDWKWYALGLVFFLLSCLSKGQAVSFVFTLMFIDFFKERKVFNSRELIEKVPFVILAVFFGLVAVNAQRGVEATQMVSFPFYDRIAFASYGLVMYILKLLVPVTLSAYYPYPIVESTAAVPFLYWACILPAACIFILLWFAWKRSKELFFGLGFFLLNIIFLLQLLPVGRAIMADRYAYIPSIGYCFLFGWFICNPNILKKRNIALVIAAAYLLLLGFLTFERSRVWDNSMDLWTDVIQKDRRVPVAWFNRGNIFSNTHEYKKAISDYNECLKEDPHYLTAYINRGEAKSKLQDYKGAVEDYNLLLRIDSGYLNGYINRANANRLMNDLNASLRDYNAAIRLKPDQVKLYTNRGAVKYELKDNKGALEDYDKAVSLDINDPSIYNERAIIKKTSGDFAGAMEDYNHAIGIDPNKGDLYNNRGNLKLQEGDAKNALLDFSAAIRCNPKDPSGFRNRGALLAKQKKYTDALADFSSAISLDATDGESFFNRALVKKELNDRAGAGKDFMKALEINPAYGASDLGRTLGISSLPGTKLNYTQYFTMGQAYENQGKLTDAIKQYQKSVELKADYAEGWFNLGTVYGKTRQFGDAINCLTKSMQFKNNYFEALSSRGIVYASTGKVEAALNDFAAAIRINPGYAAAYYNRALVCLNTGKKEQACADLKKAASLGYSNANEIYLKECQGK
ncbi:MAG: tetratricopeptide repeat protein [Bacteroidota bacterium]